MALLTTGMSTVASIIVAVFLVTGGATCAESLSDDVDEEVLQNRDVQPFVNKDVTDIHKRAMAFYPMRGRRGDDEQGIRLLEKKGQSERMMRFSNMRGKNDQSDETKRASSFYGLRGKKDESDEKRASSFFGLRGKKGGEWKQGSFSHDISRDNYYGEENRQENQHGVDDYVKNLKLAFLRNQVDETDPYLPQSLGVERKRAGAFFGMRGKRSVEQDDKLESKEE
ncbi:uncharacterized protein LOC143224812 isoform X2 [Tachypleus tridentatus]|uniref:uncharacterized protein LOC143224812 isoform X2 n=1 Tax=Tachypleus tridentatus TaxID=6853 RepID=UPI003FD6B83D